jgi:5-methylcytosine-specific restriction endonuclease McrA
MAKITDYSQQFKDPRWQKRRLEILTRDGFRCTECGDEKRMLHVHHLTYHKGVDVWDYLDRNLITLCDNCHEKWHHLRDALFDRVMYMGNKEMEKVVFELSSDFPDINNLK